MNSSPVSANSETEISNNLSFSDVYCPDDLLSPVDKFSGHKENADEIPSTKEHIVEKDDLVRVSSSWFFELTQENELFKQRIKDLEQEKEKQEREAAETEGKLSELLNQLVNTEMKLEKETEKRISFEKVKSVLEIQNENLMTEIYRHGHKKLSSGKEKIAGKERLNKKLLQKNQCIEKLNRKLFACRNKVVMKNKSVRIMKNHIKEIWEILIEFVNILSNSNQLVSDKKIAVLKKCEEFLSLEILSTESGAAVYDNISSCSTVSIPRTACNDLPEAIAKHEDEDPQDMESSQSLFITPENEMPHAVISLSNTPSSSVVTSKNLDEHQMGQESTSFSGEREASFANIQMAFSIAPFIEMDQVSNLKESNQPELHCSSSKEIKFADEPILSVPESNLEESNQTELNFSSSEKVKLGEDLVLPVCTNEISSAVAVENPIIDDSENENNPSRNAIERTGVEIPIEHSSPKIIEDSVRSVKDTLLEDLYLSEGSSDTVSTSNPNDHSMHSVKDALGGDFYLSEDSSDTVSTSNHNDQFMHSVKETFKEDFYLSEDSSDSVNASNLNDAPIKINSRSTAVRINKDLHADCTKDHETESNDKYLVPATAVVKNESVQDGLPSAIVEESEFMQDNGDLTSTSTLKNKLIENNTNLPASSIKNKRLVEDKDKFSSNLPKRSKPQLTYDELLYSLMKGDFKQNPSVVTSSSKNEVKLANNAGMENTLLIPVVIIPSETNVSTSSRKQKCLDSNTLEVETELRTKNELSITEMSSPGSNISHDPCDNGDPKGIPAIQNTLVSEKDSDCDQNSLHKEITDRSNESNLVVGTEALSINHHVLGNSINESSTDSNIFYKEITVNAGNEIASTDESDNRNCNKEFDSLMKESPNNLCTLMANKYEDGSVRLGFNLIKSCTLTLDPNNYNVACTFKDNESPIQTLNSGNFSPTLLSNCLLAIENNKNKRPNEAKLSSSSAQKLPEITLQSPDALEESNASSNSISSFNQGLADKGSTSKESSDDQMLALSESSISNPIEMLSDNNSEDYFSVSLENNGSFSAKIEKSSRNIKSKVKKDSKKKSKVKTKEKTKHKSKEKKTKKKSKEKTKKKSKEKTKNKSKKEHSNEKLFSKRVKNSKNKINKSNDTSAEDEISSEIVKDALKVVKEYHLKIFGECVDSDTDILSLGNIASLSSPNENSKSSFKSDSNNFLSLPKNTAEDSRKQIAFSFISQTSKENLNLKADDINCNERRFKDPCAVDDPYALFGVALLDENNTSIYAENAETDLHQSNQNELDLFQLDTKTCKDGSCFKNNEYLSNFEFSLSQLSDRSLNHVSPTPQSSDSLKLKLFNESPKYNDSKQILCKKSRVSIFDQIKCDFGLIEEDCSQGCESSLMNAAHETNLNEPDSPSELFESKNQSASTAILMKNTSDIVCEDDSSHSNGFLTDDSIFDRSVESIVSLLSETSEQAGEIANEMESVSSSINERNKCDDDEFREDCQQIAVDPNPCSKAKNEPISHLPAKGFTIQQVLCDKNLPVDEIQTNDIDLETASQSTCFCAEDKVGSGAKEPIIGPRSFEEILLKHMKENNREENSPNPKNFRDLIEKNPEVSCNDILSVLLKDAQSEEESKSSLYIKNQGNNKVNKSVVGLDVTVTFEDILNTHIEHVKSLEENQTYTTLGLESDKTDAQELALLNNENGSISSDDEKISNNKVTGSNLFDSIKEKTTEKIDIKVLPSDNVLSQFSCQSTDSIEQNKKLLESLNIESDANNCQVQYGKFPEYSPNTDYHIDATVNQDVMLYKEAINVLDKNKTYLKKKRKPVDNDNFTPFHVDTTVESLCKNSNAGSSELNTPGLGSGKNVLVESDVIKTTKNESSIKTNNCCVLLKRNEILHKDIENLSKESNVNKIAITLTDRKLHLHNANHDQESLLHNDINTELYDPIDIEDDLNKNENIEYILKPCCVLLERIKAPKQCLDSEKNIQPYPEKDLVRLSLDNMCKVKKIPEAFFAKNKSSDYTEGEALMLQEKRKPLRTSPRKAAFSVSYSNTLARCKTTTSLVCKTLNRNCNKRKVAIVNSEIRKKFNLKECSVVLEPVDMSLPWKHSSPSTSSASKTKPSFEINTKLSERNNDGSIKGKLLNFVKNKMNEQTNDSESPDVITKRPLGNNVRDNNNSLNLNNMNTKERTNVFFLNQTQNYGIQTRFSSVNNQISPSSSVVKSISMTSELATKNIQSESHEEISINGSACSKLSNRKQGTIPLKRTKRKNRGKSEGLANKRLRSELQTKTVEDFFKKFDFTHLNDKHFKDSVSILKEILINPENYPSISVLLYAVVKYLSLSEKNPLLMFAESEVKSVLLPPDEDCIVTAFFKIESDEAPHLRGLLKATVNIIQNLLISRKTISIYGSASLCRVATEICKRQEDKSALLTLCYNLLKSKQEFAPYLIASIVSIWMELFKENSGLSDEEIIFLSSIAYAAKVRSNLTNADWNASIKILSKYLNSRPVINVQKTINVMMDTIQVSCCDESWIHCHMLTSAVTLFAMHEDYNWIEENIIKQFVAPLLNKFGTEKVHNKAFELFCNLYVDLFLLNPTANPREELLIKFFKKENITKDCSYIQESAALALMKYLFLKNIPLPRLLTRWFEKNNSNPKVIAIRTLFTRKCKYGENKKLQEEDFELNVV